MPTNAAKKPDGQHEWTIHSLNIHGLFFERWCEEEVRKSMWGIVETNYPVEFPPPNGPLRGKEGELDIYAEQTIEKSSLRLVMECKKNNPEFVNWIFFEKLKKKSVGWTLNRNIRSKSGDIEIMQPTLDRTPINLFTADAAREVRGDYTSTKSKNKTKTANNAISDAAYQVCLATQAMARDDLIQGRALLKANSQKLAVPDETVFYPVIVTTAKLFRCEFNPTDIDGAKGEIAYEKARLTPEQFLLYQYPVPRHLQVTTKDLVATLEEDSLDMFTYSQILVVNSDHLTRLLSFIGEKFRLG